MILCLNAEIVISTCNHKAALKIEHQKHKEVSLYSSRGIQILCTTCERIGKIKSILFFIDAFEVLIIFRQ